MTHNCLMDSTKFWDYVEHLNVGKWRFMKYIANDS